jgi:plasmid stabilization system protein ParE
MTAFVLTPAAAQDLEAIWEFVAQDNSAAADRVLKALENAMRKLARNPGMGHRREDLADRCHRFLLVYSYLVVYRVETEPLQVLRVLHAARDVQALLGFTLGET